MWLAQTGRQRLEESADPEKAFLRLRKEYEAKGYSRRWVDKRLRGIAARQELTGEWYRRGATESDQFRGLTNELFEGAFGMDVGNYRGYKGLDKPTQNLRDHMTDLELALTALGETAAVALHRQRNSEGYDALLIDAQNAGQVAKAARQQIEEFGGSVVSREDPVLDGAFVRPRPQSPQREIEAASTQNASAAAEPATGKPMKVRVTSRRSAPARTEGATGKKPGGYGDRNRKTKP
jgi:hypothetical protein